MVDILTTVEEVNRCSSKTVFKTEEGYFVIFNGSGNLCGRYDEIVEKAGEGDYLLSVKMDRDSGKYSGWLMKKLDRVCPVNDAIFYTYQELLMEHKG